MKKAEELCIKYLMQETNAQEEAEIRSEMLSDADILIEYESLRSSWNKVSQLPLITPPASLTESVLRLAAEQETLHHGFFTQRWAAAAAVAATIGIGSWGAYQVSEPVLNYFARPDAASVDHWVDRNDMIYIQPNNGAYSAGSSSVIDNALYENAKKLKPVNPTPSQAGSDQAIQLAGSKKAN